MPRNRAELIAELETIFNMPVFLITYNYSDENSKGFIEQDDEFHFRQFRENVLKKRNIDRCILILNGPGGNIKTAIACSQILRDSLRDYICFIPTVIGSSLCYFALQSNRIYLGEKSIITQIDPLFNYQGEEFRAIEHLNDKNTEIRKLALETHNPTLENLKRILQNPPHAFEKEVSQESKTKIRYLERLVNSWMKGKEHDSPIKIKDLRELKVRFKIIDNETIQKAKEIIKECQKELIEENKRFVIQTSYIEDEKYFGGYFYD